MYNYNELNAVELSPTKKDYYQIWNELIEVASKLSERWDPSTTNESDPGIVLLKVLTAIADKLNYNIDANTLEAFMPSAAQESSMRKLCEMLGYEMRYYQSATTSVRIIYKGENFQSGGVTKIDQFSNIKDADSTVNYITLEPVLLNSKERKKVVNCMEGELVAVQTDLGSTVTMMHLDDNFRFYLPESRVASNGIFINNIDDSSELWQLTSNINANALQSKVYKFGYDSSRGLPYVQFPEDIGNLISTGLAIKFVRTRGADGNVSVGTLRALEIPHSWNETKTTDTTEVSAESLLEGSAAVVEDWKDLENYTITNLTAARNGKNPETIDEAYWNYQKTVGTFDTLVTCRDYMNKIYQMTNSDTDNTALVSNVIVSDIRDDINYAYTITSVASDGIETERLAKTPRDAKNGETNNEDSTDVEGTKIDGKISHFDLVLYPFQAVYGKNTEDEFNSSFTYTDFQTQEIIERLKEQKTIAHKIRRPKSTDIACIKVYARLSARLATTSKISELEAAEVELAAHTALYKNFNSRNLNFGEELPYDSILKVLTMADPRIKNVTLDDPKMTVSVCTVDGKEYPIISEDYIFDDLDSAVEAKEFYKQLVLDNVLAGRLPLFQYYTTFANNFTDKPYPKGKAFAIENAATDFPTFLSTGSKVKKLQLNMGSGSLEETNDETTPSLGAVRSISAEFKIDDVTNITNSAPLTLSSGEIIQFRAPNFKTTATYPAFVNYYVHLKERDSDSSAIFADQEAIPATMYTLREFFNGGKDGYSKTDSWGMQKSWEEKVNSMPEGLMRVKFTTAANITQDSQKEAQAWSDYDRAIQDYYAVFYKNGDKYTWFEKIEGEPILASTDYYVLDINQNNCTKFLAWLSGAVGNGSNLITYRVDVTDTQKASNGAPAVAEGSRLITSLYFKKYSTLAGGYGFLKSNGEGQYAELTSWPAAGNVFDTLYVPRLWFKEADGADGHTVSGLGRDQIALKVKANTEYSLQKDEYVLISYSTSEGREDGTTVLKNIALGKGTIIKANFELADSASKSAITKYSKTSNYGPWELDGKLYTTDNIKGMFTCAANEQIEVLEPITVTLDSPNSYLYWEVNPQNRKFWMDDSGIQYERFPLDHIDATTSSASYTLQDGEYLFFTDENMESAAYYGAGTEVKFSTDIDADNITTTDLTTYLTTYLKRPKDATKISAEALSEAGALKAIPWVIINLNDKNNLTISEYRLINLTEGDILKSVEFPKLSDASDQSLGKQYRNVSTAMYSLSGQDYTLPLLAVDGASWQVRSLLSVNMGPAHPQVLNTHKKQNGGIFARNYLSIKDDAEEEFVLSPFESDVSMAVYADVPLVGIAGNLNFEAESMSSVLTAPKAFKICEHISDQESSLAFDADGFAQVDLSKTTSTGSVLDLNILIPKESASKATTPNDTAVEDTTTEETAEPVSDDPSSEEATTDPSTTESGTTESTTTTTESNTPEEDTSDHSLSDGTTPEVSTPKEPSSHYGLLPIYYEANKSKFDDSSAKIKLSSITGDGATIAAGIFNHGGFNVKRDQNGEVVEIVFSPVYMTWWEGQSDADGNQYLRPGLNMIVIPSSCKLSLYRGNASLIKVGRLKIIPEENMINYQLAFASHDKNLNLKNSTTLPFRFYYEDDEGNKKVESFSISDHEALLYIKDLDEDFNFLYTVEPSKVSGLDLNELDPADTMAQPKAWFDKQNVANKFVVSALDSDYLKKFVSVSKYSKIF